MRKVTFTQIEVSGIQEYIFGSNNLKQNMGASELVTAATTDWVIEALKQLDIAHNAYEQNGKWQLTPWSTDLKPAQIVYWGGGNALILFSGRPEQYAIPFTRSLSRYAIQRARGLSLIVEHKSFDWDTKPASVKHTTLRRKIMASRKLNRFYDTPLLGLGVTAGCVFTGLPAVAVDEDKNYISQAVQDKGKAFVQATERLTNLFQSRYDFVEDFNLLGEHEQSSYTAVIHADGNGMGQRFQDIAESHPSVLDNDAYCRQLRQLSQAIAEKSESALKATVTFLLNSYDRQTEKFGKVVPAPFNNEKQSPMLPFRPIVFGGDDVTFVSEGRLGLALTAYYLKKLAEGNLPGAKEGEIGDPLYARAGIAIVKTHYPFARAYELAEALAKSAKDKLGELTPNGKGIVLDWHFATSSVVLSLKQLRQREYYSEDRHNLLMRPVRLDLGEPPQGNPYWRSWDNFVAITYQLQQDKNWARNKVKALREPLRRGGLSVKLFRQNYGLPSLPLIPGQSDVMSKTGWNSGDCGYFDAIEALDFYVHLQEQNYG